METFIPSCRLSSSHCWCLKKMLFPIWSAAAASSSFMNSLSLHVWMVWLLGGGVMDPRCLLRPFWGVWCYTGIYTPKGSSKRKLVKERERERVIITKEVWLIKKKFAKLCTMRAKFCTRQAMIDMAWSTCQAVTFPIKLLTVGALTCPINGQSYYK